VLVLVDIPKGTPEETVRACSYLLEALILMDMDILRREKWIPPLYRSRVRYQAEPPGQERFDHPLICMERGWGDCDDLVGWRCAELRLAGEHATPRILWPEGTRRYHAQLRRADGTIEDPSRTLMRLHKVRS